MNKDFNTLDKPSVKFDKSFEALYNIAMNMADTCIVNQTIESRFSKLEEEYQEVIRAFQGFNSMVPTRIYEGKPLYNGEESREHTENIIGELSDILFVLLHIAHRLSPGCTAFELLHMATTKMLSRMNDPEYVAKI